MFQSYPGRSLQPWVFHHPQMGFFTAEMDGNNTAAAPASRFTPHASRFTLHASRFTPHASRFTPPTALRSGSRAHSAAPPTWDAGGPW
ncbi:MAG: hypothetical protein EOO12_07635 [Chitinophagaceae bacterium]|nr:MAG: hypothetical protein EOO12_07635 [Chitinophagaceae bacterium]